MSRSRYGTLGDKHPSEYNAWRNMKRSCLDPRSRSYRHYGACGITICPEWIHSFARFLADVGPKPSRELWLCRTNTGENYEPANVRWGPKEQQMPKRKHVLRLVMDGIPLTIREAAGIVGIQRKTLLWRLKHHGQPTTPLSNPAT